MDVVCCFMYPFFSVRPVSSGAMPNGFIIKDYKIEKTTETNWTISLLPANCGSPMPLFSVVEHTGNENGSPDDVTYTRPGLNSSVRVRRVQEASPPIEGMFDIEYRGNVIKGEWFSEKKSSHTIATIARGNSLRQRTKIKTNLAQFFYERASYIMR